DVCSSDLDLAVGRKLADDSDDFRRTDVETDEEFATVALTHGSRAPLSYRFRPAPPAPFARPPPSPPIASRRAIRRRSRSCSASRHSSPDAAPARAPEPRH